MTTDDKVILLVDDDPDDVELTLRAFRNNPLGNKIVVARDGIEALDYLRGTGRYAGRDPSRQPQVVLLDLNLPVIDGLEVLRRIRAEERFRRLPVVILTSSNEDSDKVAGYGLGANSYVRKPVDFHQFSDAVTRLGLYWMLVNEPPPR
ncbi:MAG TPA: response regulator [Kofleriaceae bacterium]|nr:response regulator [Kofleriaceae bacterium]